MESSFPQLKFLPTAGPAVGRQPEVGAMRIGDRYQFAWEQQERYWAAGKAEGSRILDAICLR